MTGYDIGEWHDAFVATAGAAAALAGLVFVAVSINIERILAIRGAPERGLQAVLLLVAAVIVSVFVLIPQSIRSLGIEVLVVATALLGWFLLAAPRLLAGTRGRPSWWGSRLFVFMLGALPYAAGGLTLIVGASGGLIWIVAGLIGAFLSAVISAWVLLVEILR